MSTQLVLINQFGEESINQIQAAGTTLPGSAPIPTKTVVMNNTGGSALATAVTVADLTTALPTAGITAKVLTGLAAGANTPITAADSILVALANLQAQINAL